MTDILCAIDGRPVGDNAYVCSHCAEHLARCLGDVTAVVEEFRPKRDRDGKIAREHYGRQPSTPLDYPTGERGNLSAELDLTRLRQSTTGRNGGAAAETPVPWDQRAREASWVLDNTIGTWARVVEEERGSDLPGYSIAPEGPAHAACQHSTCERIRATPPTTAEMARWLLNHVEWLRHHAAGAEAVDEITSAVQVALLVVDIRPERWYAGPCDDCGTDLYGRPARAQVVCPNDECARVYNVAERRKQLLDAAQDHLANASLIARAVTMLGESVTPDRVWKWAQRGRIVAHSTDLKGRPLYRVGDVLDLVANEADRLARRGERSA